MGTRGGTLSGLTRTCLRSCFETGIFHADNTGQGVALETGSVTVSVLAGLTCPSELGSLHSGIAGWCFALECELLPLLTGLSSFSSLGSFQGQLYLTGLYT